MRALEYIALHSPEKLIERDYNGWAPIHEAVYRGDLEGVQFLLENGARVEDRIEKPGGIPDMNVLELFQKSPTYSANPSHPLTEFLMSQQVQAEL
jgi:ankyrin repeat protein